MADTPATPAADTPKETKGDHFKRLAVHRTNQIIEWSEKLGRLNNPNLYEYTDEQVTAIEEALTKAVQDAVAALKNRTGKKSGFTL